MPTNFLDSDDSTSHCTAMIISSGSMGWLTNRYFPDETSQKDWHHCPATTTVFSRFRSNIPLHVYNSTIPMVNFTHNLFTDSLSISSGSPTALRCYSTSPQASQKDPVSAKVPDQRLPHLTQQSVVHQISISSKPVTFRRALAIGHVVFSNPKPLTLIREHSLQKGDVLAVARVAGIMAVKKTGDIIPLAHGGVGVEGCEVDVEVVGSHGSDLDNQNICIDSKLDSVSAATTTDPKLDRAKRLLTGIGSHGGIRIAVSVSTTAKTGIEMEALTGVVGAGLTVIDMCKAVDRHLKLEGVAVVGKSGGKSGAWGVYSEDKDK